MKKSMYYESSPIIFENARRLRNEPTASEVIFWGVLKQHFSEYKFRRQHPISDFIADFYCHKLQLVIEIDGSIHNSIEAKEKDQLRDEFMQSLNLNLIRFTNEEVCKSGEVVVKKLKEIIVKISNTCDKSNLKS